MIKKILKTIKINNIPSYTKEWGLIEKVGVFVPIYALKMRYNPTPDYPVEQCLEDIHYPFKVKLVEHNDKKLLYAIGSETALRIIQKYVMYCVRLQRGDDLFREAGKIIDSIESIK